MDDQTIQTDIVFKTSDSNPRALDDFNRKLKEIGKSLAQIDKDYEKSQRTAQQATQKTIQEFRRLDTELLKAGHGLKQLGDAFGSEALSRVGQFTAGLGGILSTATAIGDAFKTISKSPLASGLLAVAGSAIAGSSIYDATIGKAQGTNTATILDQLGQFAAAGFNVDQLEMNVKQAMIKAGTLSPVSDLLPTLVPKTPQQLAREKAEKFLGPTMPSAYLDPKQAEILRAQQARKDELLRELEDEKYQRMINARSESYAKYFEYISQKDEARQKKDMQIADLESNIATRRAQAAQSLAADLAKMEQDYYANRLKAAQDFGVESARMEQDHQRDMQRMQQDHAKRLRNLAESRDALAIEDEVDSYNTERDRAEEDYQISAARRSEDFARQLNDMETAFRQQRQARINQYNQQLSELNDYLNTQRQVILNQFTALIQAIENVMTGKTQQQNQQLLQNQIYGQSPNWTGPTPVSISQSFQFGNVSNPRQIATIVHQELTHVIHEAMRS